MSHVTNQKAIDATNSEKYAIFITKLNNRYAVKAIPGGYASYLETNRGWWRVDNVANFLIWNGEFQGFDDISSLIEE